MGVTDLVLKRLINVIFLDINNHKKDDVVTRHLYLITIIVTEK
jgi:hypothetical protein